MRQKGAVAPDSFSQHYHEHLDGTYDCVDRIVVNAYFTWGQTPAGFRAWWRQWQGSDEELSDAYLMRLAGRFSRRIRAWAKKNNIPIEYVPVKEDKHQIADPYVPTDPDFRGVFLVVVGRAPNRVWHIERAPQGYIRDIKATRPYVNHYTFHIIDPQWGHLTIKICGHPPFTAQIALNGHEFVERQARPQGLEFTKEGNCFTAVSNAADLATVAETLSSPSSVGRLAQVCERWIYSACLCFALDLDEQQRSHFHYDYSVYQAEYSRNLLFRWGNEMEQVFASVIDRTRTLLGIKTVRTLFGQKHRPHWRRNKKKQPRMEIVIERPTYDLTIFKVHFGKRTLKIYTKGERVLRIEAVVHNARDFPCGTSLPRFPQIVALLQQMIARFMEVLDAVDASCLEDGTLQRLPAPSQVGAARVGGIDINKARMRAVLEAVVALSPVPTGFTASDLATQVRHIQGSALQAYGPTRAAYDLRKLRGKGLVQKIGKSRRYQATPQALRTIVALLVFRDKVVKPILAAVTTPTPVTGKTPIDQHYANIQKELHQLCQAFGLAA